MQHSAQPAFMPHPLPHTTSLTAGHTPPLSVQGMKYKSWVHNMMDTKKIVQQQLDDICDQQNSGSGVLMRPQQRRSLPEASAGVPASDLHGRAALENACVPNPPDERPRQSQSADGSGVGHPPPRSDPRGPSFVNCVHMASIPPPKLPVRLRPAKYF